MKLLRTVLILIPLTIVASCFGGCIALKSEVAAQYRLRQELAAELATCQQSKKNVEDLCMRLAKECIDLEFVCAQRRI